MMTMCKLRWLCVMVAVALVTAAPVFAQGTGRRGPRGRGGLQPMGVQEAVRQLDLTAEQKEKAAPILKADGEARQKLMQEMREAFRGEDAEARTAVRKKITALDAKTKQQLAAVLTKEQAAKLERMTGPGGAFDRFVAMVEKVSLTDEQKTQLASAVKTANADAAAKADEAGKVYQEAVTKITGMLTEEQRTKLGQLRQAQQLQARVDRMLENVTLTEEQKAKVAKLVEQAQKDSMAATDRQARREVMQKLTESVRNDVLTEEQRSKLPAPRSRQ
jgi:Spy/CpxP family protein refolding chaperone